MGNFLKSLGLLIWFSVSLRMMYDTYENDYGLWELLMAMPLLILMSLIFNRVFSLTPDENQR